MLPKAVARVSTARCGLSSPNVASLIRARELVRLPNPVGIAQALDERGAHQELLRQNGILTRALHPLAILLPRLRIALLHVLLVCDGRGLDVLHRHMAPLAQIAVERALILLTVEDAQQIGGEIDDVVARDP